MSSARDLFECPHCGESFPRRRPACPHCGSDAETGWRQEEEIEAAETEGWRPWLDDEEYAEWLERDASVPHASRPLAMRLRRFAALAVLILLIVLFAVLYALP